MYIIHAVDIHRRLKMQIIVHDPMSALLVNLYLSIGVEFHSVRHCFRPDLEARTASLKTGLKFGQQSERECEYYACQYNLCMFNNSVMFYPLD